MAVIKANSAPSQARPFSMADIEAHARGMLLKARQQAEQLLAAAQTEADLLREQARMEGAAQGRTEGLAKGKEEGLKAGKDQAYKEQTAQLQQLVTTLTKTSTDLNNARRALAAEGVEDVVNLAISISDRVTKQRGLLDPSVAISNVAEALKLVSHASDIKIAIHPTQLAALTQALPVLRMQWPQLQHVQLVEDAMLSPGGCRIFTTQGHVDGDLDEQIRRIVADLLPSTDSTAEMIAEAS